MEHQAKVAALFDEMVGVYDAVGVDFFRPIAAGLVGELAPRAGERALDIGCGRGAALFPLAAAVGRSGSVTGIDVSPAMVQATADDIHRGGLDDVIDVRVGDAMAPDFAPGSFDVVASSLVLFFLPDPLAALRAWRPLLADGGRVGVSTFGPYTKEWADTVDAVMTSYATPGVSDARVTGVRGPFESDEGMEALFADAGFRGVRTVTATVKPRFDDPEHWYRWSMSVGIRQFWMSIPPEDLDRVKAGVFAAVDRCRDEHGRIGFDQQVRYTLAEA